jgi:hypothetical protein
MLQSIPIQDSTEKKKKKKKIKKKWNIKTYVHEKVGHTMNNEESSAGAITKPVKPINHVLYCQYLLIQ